jgi:hypothetical protein
MKGYPQSRYGGLLICSISSVGITTLPSTHGWLMACQPLCFAVSLIAKSNEFSFLIMCVYVSVLLLLFFFELHVLKTFHLLQYHKKKEKIFRSLKLQTDADQLL